MQQSAIQPHLTLRLTLSLHRALPPRPTPALPFHARAQHRTWRVMHTVRISSSTSICISRALSTFSVQVSHCVFKSTSPAQSSLFSSYAAQSDFHSPSHLSAAHQLVRSPSLLVHATFHHHSHISRHAVITPYIVASHVVAPSPFPYSWRSPSICHVPSSVAPPPSLHTPSPHSFSISFSPPPSPQVSLRSAGARNVTCCRDALLNSLHTNTFAI